jgi:drug/metabolite transporter (DMT)-like permease
LAAAVLWSTSGLFVKNDVFDDWPMEERGLLLAFWRALFAGGMFIPFIRGPRWDWKLLPMTGCFALMSVSYLFAMTLTTAANAIWLQSTAPLWVCLFGWVLLRRKPQRRDFLPLALCALGLSVILIFELRQPDATRLGGNWAQLGLCFGLLAGACYAGVVMFLHSLRDQSAVWLVALNHLATATVLFPYVLYVGRWPNPTQWLVLAGFGLLQLGLPYLLFSRGLKSISSQEASLLALLEPVLVPVWVLLVLGNHETRWWTLVGGGLVCIGLALRCWPGLERPAKNLA